MFRNLLQSSKKSLCQQTHVRWSVHIFQCVFRPQLSNYLFLFVSSTKYTISFDDGDEKTHNIGDKSAVIVDKCPQVIKAGQHVVGRWKGSSKYYIGFVKEITSSGKFAVRLDNNKEDLYNKCDLRIFPDHTNPYERKFIFSVGFQEAWFLVRILKRK